jgi:hypothetical protein
VAGICEAQTTVGAGNLVLNGALCDLGTASQFDIGDAYSAGIGGVILEFDSVGDISGVTFTITGKSPDGNSQTEDVTGVTTTEVQTTKYWSQVTQIAADGAVGSNVTVGTSQKFVTKTIPLNSRYDHETAVAATVTGTIQFDIDESYSDVRNAPETFAWIAAQSNKTADLSASLTRHACAVRLKSDSYTNGAEIAFTVISGNAL